MIQGFVVQQAPFFEGFEWGECTNEAKSALRSDFVKAVDGFFQAIACRPKAVYGLLHGFAALAFL